MSGHDAGAGALAVAPAPADVVERCQVANDLWLSFCSALTLSCLRSHGQDAIGDLEYGSLRRHQLKHFRDGIEKLGLDAEPSDAVRCAKYHYFSNSLGGRRMEYVEESPTKVWIRYRPPFWICDGVDAPMASIAALGPPIGRAAFRAWHAHNGALLGNPRLAFVQTQSQCDGDPWEAGYFIERDRVLEPEETYERRPGEWGPPFDPARAPTLPHTTWPAERLARALRNFAVDHTASRIAVLTATYGIVDAAAITEHAWRVVLLQRSRWLPQALGLDAIDDARTAAVYFARAAALIDDDVEVEPDDGAAIVRHPSARLWRDEPVALPGIEQAIARAWEATLPLHVPGIRVTLERAASRGDADYAWRFAVTARST